MKQGFKTVNDLAVELQRQAKAKRDFRTPTEKMTMMAETQTAPRVYLEGLGHFNVGQTAHQQIASHLKIPKDYYDRMLKDEPTLLAENVNRWLHKTPETRLVRTLDGNVRAFLSPRYRMIDNWEVAEAALPALQRTGAAIVSSQITESHLYVKAVTERLTAKVKGDIVQMGVALSNSEIGHASVRIEPLLYVLACLNGAIVQDQAVRRFHVGRNLGDAAEAYEVYKDDTMRADDKAFMLKVRDALDAAFTEAKFKTLVGRAVMATKGRLEINPSKPLTEVVEVTARTLATTQEEGNGILQYLLKGGDLTRWGLSNAVTRYAQDVSSYDRATVLERTGGDVLNMPPEEWTKLTAELM